MARYVLLAFDDNEQADKFVSAVNSPGGVIVGAYDQDGISYDALPHESVYVRATYMKPTVFCDCAKKGLWGKGDGWARGKKYGLWVHNKCGKPSWRWARGDSWFVALGKNLLPLSDKAPEWRGDGIQDHHWEPTQQQWVHNETGEPWVPAMQPDELGVKA